jgi:hypothetical protein
VSELFDQCVVEARLPRMHDMGIEFIGRAIEHRHPQARHFDARIKLFKMSPRLFCLAAV